MPGDKDVELEWPFTQKVSMTLIDQKEGKTHWTYSFRPDPKNVCFFRPVCKMNTPYGYHQFASHSAVEIGKYLAEDTLLILIEVGDSPSLVSSDSSPQPKDNKPRSQHHKNKTKEKNNSCCIIL
ncbi:hypothetical protein [Endozoicomonas sp. Mp262]